MDQPSRRLRPGLEESGPPGHRRDREPARLHLPHAGRGAVGGEDRRGEAVGEVLSRVEGWGGGGAYGGGEVVEKRNRKGLE